MLKNILQKTIFRCVVTTLALTPFLFAAPPAGAQEDRRAIEEIVVTAEKRAESVQDIGLSITALDADTMEQFGITDVRRLGFAVAGIVYADAGNDAKFNVRGANSTNTFRDNASIVGAYVDGVYKAKASQQTRAFFDVERLEFLKGPQGTLYGRNTFAGALNVYTFKPNTEGVAGGLTTSFERYSTLRTEGFINVPVNDTTAVRVAGYSENGDGYIKNSAGQNAGAPDSLGLRFSAMFEPSDNLDFLLRYQYVEEKGTAAGLFGYALTCRNTDANGLTDAFGAVRDCQNPNRGTFAEPRGDAGGPYRIAQDFLPDHDLSETMFSLEINWDAGPVMVKSITSYTDFENKVPFDFDFSPTNASIGGFDEFVESVTQEFVVSSNYDSAFQWTAGAYYSNDDYFNTFWIYNPVRADNSVRPVDPVTGLTVLNGTPLVSSAIDINGQFGDSNYIDATVKAVFTQGEFSVSDSLRLIAGVRVSDEDKDAHGGGSNFTANGPVTFIATETNGTYPQTRLGSFSFDENAAGANSIDRSYSNTSWKAGIEYDVNDDSMLYFTASTGFLSGSLNNDGTSTDEQESKMYEVGIKSVLMDGTMLFNLAYYDTEYTNLVAQLQTIDPVTGVAITTTRNGGDIDARGIDLELQYLPTDELRLGFTMAWLDAEYGEFGQTSPYQLNRGVITTFESQNGTTPGWSPELMANFNADYTIALANGGTLTPAIMIAYSDDYDTSNLYTPDPLTQQDAFTKTDLRLTWRSPDENYTVAIYVENLEDEAVLSRSNNGSQDHIQTGFLYPQNYGVSFQVRWE